MLHLQLPIKSGPDYVPFLCMQASEPALASYLYSTVLAHDSIEKTLAFLLANKLASLTMLPTQLMRLIQDVYEDDPDIVDAACADLQV
jgi:serine O-acetyltransferase